MRLRTLLGGVGIGIVLGYLLDREHGRARRERLRHRIERLLPPRERPAAPARPAAVAAGGEGTRRGDIAGFAAAAQRGMQPQPGGRIGRSGAALGLAGGALTAFGIARRGPMGATLGTVGFGLLATGLQDVELPGVVPRRERRRIVDIQKSIEVAAPVDRVYAFWADYENFPLFMTTVRRVADLGGGRSHWRVAGPAGIPLEWTAVVTQQVPHQVLAWHTVPGSMLQHSGMIRFEEVAGGTRVDVRLCYTPLAGGLGRAVAEMLGADPRLRINDDLDRMKALLEAAGSRPDDPGGMMAKNQSREFATMDEDERRRFANAEGEESEEPPRDIDFEETGPRDADHMGPGLQPDDPRQPRTTRRSKGDAGRGGDAA